MVGVTTFYALCMPLQNDKVAVQVTTNASGAVCILSARQDWGEPTLRLYEIHFELPNTVHLTTTVTLINVFCDEREQLQAKRHWGPALRDSVMAATHIACVIMDETCTW